MSENHHRSLAPIISNFLLFLLIFSLFLNCKSKIAEAPENTLINIEDYGAAGDGATDDSKVFQKIFDQYKSLRLILSNGKTYNVKNLEYFNAENITIYGNGAKLKLVESENSKNVLTISAVKKIKITDLSIEGDYGYNFSRDFLLKIVTPDSRTDSIVLSDLTVKNGFLGNVLIQNVITKTNRFNPPGAKYISVDNCQFIDFGTKMGLKIGGSHEQVFVSNCTAITSRAINAQVDFDFGAQLSYANDMMNTLVLTNLKSIGTTTKALMLQQIKYVALDTFTSYKAGIFNLTNPELGSVSVIKVDDLGFGNSAILKNCTAVESARELKGIAFISIEETPNNKFGHSSNVEITKFDSDLLLRIGASGHCIIDDGIQRNAHIHLKSSHNIVQNVRFLKSDYQETAIHITHKKNVIKNCFFEDGGINVFNSVSDIEISKSELSQSSSRDYLIVLHNNKNIKSKLEIEDCVIPNGFWLLKSSGYNKPTNTEILIKNKTGKFPIHKNMGKQTKIKKLIKE